jgi:hypothetical protein
VSVSDLLERGAAWLADQLRTHVSTAVSYQRDDEQVAIQATVGRTLLKLDDGEGGVVLQWTDRDFLISAADLVLGGFQTVPQRGDRIREARGAVTHVYEVMAPGDEPPWRYSDPYGKILRIHTKLVLTE